jgi:hypothetical protein
MPGRWYIIDFARGRSTNLARIPVIPSDSRCYSKSRFDGTFQPRLLPVMTRLVRIEVNNLKNFQIV